mmetsp:Transcript_13078/g.38064  ORF Transcript_13078/g.38064 Transcript_13078/m.38064 type:complete len:344 (-) Transcript_13078:1786-2817(-)
MAPLLVNQNWDPYASATAQNVPREKSTYPIFVSVSSSSDRSPSNALAFHCFRCNISSESRSPPRSRKFFLFSSISRKAYDVFWFSSSDFCKRFTSMTPGGSHGSTRVETASFPSLRRAYFANSLLHFLSSVEVSGSNFQSFRNSCAALRKAQLHKDTEPIASINPWYSMALYRISWGNRAKAPALRIIHPCKAPQGPHFVLPRQTTPSRGGLASPVTSSPSPQNVTMGAAPPIAPATQTSLSFARRGSNESSHPFKGGGGRGGTGSARNMITQVTLYDGAPSTTARPGIFFLCSIAALTSPPTASVQSTSSLTSPTTKSPSRENATDPGSFSTIPFDALTSWA